MKNRTVGSTTYYPKTAKIGNQYMPVIGFSCPTMTDSYYLAHDLKDTRSKARSAAIKYIKEIKD